MQRNIVYRIEKSTKKWLSEECSIKHMTIYLGVWSSILIWNPIPKDMHAFLFIYVFN